MSKQQQRPNAVEALAVEQLIGGAIARARQARELSLTEMESVAGGVDDGRTVGKIVDFAVGVKLPIGDDFPGGPTVGLIAPEPF